MKGKRQLREKASGKPGASAWMSLAPALAVLTTHRCPAGRPLVCVFSLAFHLLDQD